MGRMMNFLGKRAQDTLPYYYSEAYVLVMPSHYESFGMVALEAMACGTPVIAARAGALPEVVGDAAPLVDPRSVPAMTAAIEDLLGSPALQSRCASQGPQRAGAFQWSAAASRVEDLLRSLA